MKAKLFLISLFLLIGGTVCLAEAQQSSLKIPSTEQLKSDLSGQDIVFTQPFGIFKTKDSLVLDKDDIEDVKVIDSKKQGDILNLKVKITVVGMMIGQTKNLVLATGQMRYKVEGQTLRFLDFKSLSAGEKPK